MVEGIVACAATRASSSDVADTSRVRRRTALCVNRKTATTSTLPPTNRAVFSSVLKRDEVPVTGRIMRGSLPWRRAGRGIAPRPDASGPGLQHVEAAEPGPQCLGNDHRAVGLLMVL